MKTLEEREDGPAVDLLIEADGHPATALAAIQRMAGQETTNDDERELLRVLQGIVERYRPLAYVRFKCSITIEQSGESSPISLS